MRPPDLEKLRQSGRISARAREHGRKLIKPGARIEPIALEVEQMIRDLGGKPAFPAQLSRNNIAAHYCSPPGDPTELLPDDIVKLDLGTQVDGYVTDNAVTVDLRDGPRQPRPRPGRCLGRDSLCGHQPAVFITDADRSFCATDVDAE